MQKERRRTAFVSSLRALPASSYRELQQRVPLEDQSCRHAFTDHSECTSMDLEMARRSTERRHRFEKRGLRRTLAFSACDFTENGFRFLVSQSQFCRDPGLGRRVQCREGKRGSSTTSSRSARKRDALQFPLAFASLLFPHHPSSLLLPFSFLPSKQWLRFVPPILPPLPSSTTRLEVFSRINEASEAHAPLRLLNFYLSHLPSSPPFHQSTIPTFKLVLVGDGGTGKTSKLEFHLLVVLGGRKSVLTW